MAKYYYDRYVVDLNYTERLSSSTYSVSLRGNKDYWIVTDTLYDSYSFNTTTGIYRGAGTLYPETAVEDVVGKCFVRSTGDYIVLIQSYMRETTAGFQFNGRRYDSLASYTRGSYHSTIIAEDETYPDNGREGTTYWYIKRNKAFPDFKVKAEGQLKTAEEGWVKVNGVLRPIEQMWVKINGIIKEV